MPSSEGIVRRRSVYQAWRRAEGLEFWVMLRTASSDFEAFDAAVREANRAAVAAGHEDPMFAGDDSVAPGGFIVLIAHSEDQSVYEQWLTALEQALADAGLAGTLTSPPEPPIPPWMLDTRPREPTGFFLWSLGDAPRGPELGFPGRWQVPGPQTQAICALADELRPEHVDEAIFQHGMFRLALAEARVGPMMKRALPSEPLLVVDYTTHAPSETVRFTLGPPNNAAYQIVGEGTDDWAGHVDAVRDVLVSVAAMVDVAFIRPSARAVLSLRDVECELPLPGLKTYHMSHNPHLLSTYAPDAHGVQVLTTRHLEGARTLDGWRVTDLGGDRHLVEAPDLAPWYRSAQPDPETLAQARHDFGDMLLTTDVIDANPAPWRTGL